MASAAVSTPVTAPHQLHESHEHTSVAANDLQETTYKPHHVLAGFHYYLDPNDGSLPAPGYVDRPESFTEKPIDTRNLLVHDIRGEEQNYTLDQNGFQIYRNVSREKDFLDDEKIKAEYYPEVEQLLKEA